MDPAVTPPGQDDVTVIALIAIAVTTLVGLVDRLGKVVIRWIARRLRVPEDDSAERMDRLESKLDRLLRDRRESQDGADE